MGDSQAEKLSREDLDKLRAKLDTMSVTGLRDFYFAAHYRCRLDDATLPTARDIQQLVQAWKALRRSM